MSTTTICQTHTGQASQRRCCYLKPAITFVKRATASTEKVGMFVSLDRKEQIESLGGQNIRDEKGIAEGYCFQKSTSSARSRTPLIAN